MKQSSADLRWAFWGVLTLAGSIIVFQIALTRVFAIMMWHHLTYMAVSIALLGFGAAGSLLTARGDAAKSRSPFPTLALSSAGYAVSVVLAFCFTTLVRLDSIHLQDEPRNILALLLIYLIVSVPFLFGGIAIGLALSRFPKQVNKLYFYDLVGSAAGGIASVFLLNALGGPGTIMVASALGGVAALLFGLGAKLRHVLTGGATTLAGFFLVYAFATGSTWEVPFAPGKEMGGSPEKMPESRIPSATAEVEVSTNRSAAPMIGGNFGRHDAIGVEARYVAQDGTAPTMMYKNAAEIARFPFLDDSQAGSAYVCRKAVHEAAGIEAEGPKVLVIGVGGGVDVMVALAHEAREVTAVEINRGMIKMVTEDYDDYLGGLFTGAYPDRVKLVKEEGRAYMRHSDERFDIIQMSGVDSFTALSTGAYTLSESYLYTVEAIKEFYDHLEEGGYINYSRFILNHPKKPRETLRLANIAREALSQIEGIEDPAAQICVFQGEDWASTVIKRGTFSAEEIKALADFARVQVFWGLVFDPTLPAEGDFPSPAVLGDQARLFFDNALNQTLGPVGVAPELAAACANELIFAYEQVYRGDDPGEVYTKVMEMLPESAREAAAERIPGFVAAAVDQGRMEATNFVATRRDFRTVLRSSDDERLAFLEDYEYDLSPCIDDKPFFFDYYKYSGLFDRLGKKIRGEEIEGPAAKEMEQRYHPDFPVGHMVLLASLTQIFLLAFVLIILPLGVLKQAGVKTPGKLIYFLYFAALGVGFMFAELALMQRINLFLGHPTYALSVVLSTLLFFAGLGSFVAGKIKRIGRGTLLGMTAAIVGVLLFEAWASQALLDKLLGLGLATRITVVVALLAPLGFVLGMPFPSGLRILRSRCPALVPWGWAINGFCSVFASVLCIVLSQQIGFTKVIWIAAAVYAVGLLPMKTELASASTEEDAS